MLKVAVVLMELLRRALFKHKEEHDLTSPKFDALKVTIFLYIVLSIIFSILSIKTITSNIIEVQDLKDQIKKYTIHKECIDKETAIKSSDLITRIENCSKG